VTYYYLDSNPLLRWAEAKRPAVAEARCLRVEAVLNSWFESQSDTVAASEVTLIEVHSNLYSIWRDTKEARSAFDDGWLNDVQTALMGLIESGDLVLLALSPKAFELAMRYIGIAADEHRRYLDSWDAVHLHQAERWARDAESVVQFVSSDGGLANFFDLFPELGQCVELHDIEASGTE
jgi:hypothetical protein